MKTPILIAALLTLSACEADENSFTFPPITAEDVVIDTTPKPAGPARVDFDLSGELRDVEGNVRVYQVTTVEELIDGPISHGKIGDWILENDQVKFLIEGDDRVMSPCPYGGTVLDISYKEGESKKDILGEVCLFINAAQTLDPEAFEVVPTDKNAAILAVTGKLQLGDYINIKGTVDEFIPGLSARLPVNPDDLLPVTVTVFYILHPGELGLRVLTVLRNDSEEQVDALIAHLVMSGGDGGYFNPLAGSAGFGAGSGGFSEDPVPFVAFRGDKESYLFMPDITPEIPASVIPLGGSSLTISGVAAVASSIGSIVGTLTNRNFATAPGVLHIAPGQTGVAGHRQFGGDGAVSTMLDEVYPLMGIETGALEGQVRDGLDPAANVRVSAVLVGANGLKRTMSQAITDADGNYRMIVPVGSYELLARRGNQVADVGADDFVTAGGVSVVDPMPLSQVAKLNVNIKEPSGMAVPGRVTVICDGPCNNAPTNLETDISTNKLPSGWQSVTWAGIDGVVELELPAGDYKIYVTRGFEWSTWPYDAMPSNGYALSVADDDVVTLDAEIAHVVNTEGALSADFHVHALPSPDSPVPQETRVLNFLGEGVDVIVSTDHDIIADYAPTIESIGASTYIASLIGVEITTGNTGHFIAFPMQRDTTQRRGGTLDWSRGPLNDMEPVDIFRWAADQPGTQVVQINHPAGMGLINNTKADVLRGLTFKDRAALRMDERDPDPVTGDTGIWTDEFTAMEVMSGSSLGTFYGVGRWWLQMVGRGFTPTATAVTDTHKLYNDLGGSPRTYIFVPNTSDTPATFDSETFTTAVNAGRVIGSRGPFFHVEMTNGAGTMGTIGDVVETNGSPVTATVKIDVPEWMPVTTVDVYMNLTDEILTRPAELIEAAWTPTVSVPISLSETDLVEAEVGTAIHRHYVKEIEIPLTTDVDAWVVFVVRGSSSMSPLAPDQTPFAFSNPVYLDADGGGYNNPPLKDLAQTLPPVASAAVDDHAAEQLGKNGELPELTPELLLEALNHNACVR